MATVPRQEESYGTHIPQCHGMHQNAFSWQVATVSGDLAANVLFIKLREGN